MGNGTNAPTHVQQKIHKPTYKHVRNTTPEKTTERLEQLFTCFFVKNTGEPTWHRQ